MVRKFAIVVAAFLALILAACGGGTAADDVEIIIWDRDATDENPFYGETLTIATWGVRAQRLRSDATLVDYLLPSVQNMMVDWRPLWMPTRILMKPTGL